jgi:hypothetical protein
MPPIIIRYDLKRYQRALVATSLVGTAAAFLMAAGATVRRSLFARLWVWLDVPPGIATFVLVESIVLIAVGYAALQARRRRDEIRLLPQGFEIHDSLGSYLVEWDNIAETGVSGGSMAGIRLRDRARLVEMHTGSEEQRALLASRELFGGYDLLFARHDLDCGVERFLSALERYRRSPEARAELAE